jgi:hypothetical protein
MKTKKYIFVSIAVLLAVFVSACAGAAPELPVANGDAGTTIIAQPQAEAGNGNQPLDGAPNQGGRGQGDLTAAAEALGVTVEQLQQALQDARPAECASADGQPVQGIDCRADLNAAATALGVTVEELQAALGFGRDGGRGERDLTAAAEALGVTVEELQQAIQAAKPAECAEGTQPAQGVDCRPNVEALAETLGVTVEELEAALGQRGGLDFAAAAEAIGVTEEELQQALEDSRPAECADAEGQPRDPNCRPDFDAAAASLGVTAEELREALGKPEGGHRGPGGPGGQDGQNGPNGGQQPPAGGQAPAQP